MKRKYHMFIVICHLCPFLSVVVLFRLCCCIQRIISFPRSCQPGVCRLRTIQVTHSKATMEGKAGADPFIIEIILCSLFLYFETPFFTVSSLPLFYKGVGGDGNCSQLCGL
ncbi:hypothetical protein BDV41DRAFT_225962 [Aspergillus transmontanensis]|uniref:Uncharacterized protein n=1 Tax=Aspergillus transmontanensis TaxID=1034304 RepID=A0A5N6W008_9EURO|nr:hypothetical protein BDV41DRAFT_225962 [Aspergillus transmontanensis]